MRNCRLTVAALVFTLAAATANALAQNSNTANGSSSTAVTPGYSWLQISAFTNVPVAGADVSVRDSSGNLIFQQEDATNNQGVSAAHVKNLPRNFRVTVTLDGDESPDLDLGALGRFKLRADVRDFNPVYGVVYVNPGTTLASMVADRLPVHSLRIADGLVRRFLVLPANYDLGDALRQGPYYRSPYFSEAAFLGQARQRGGLDPFLNSLVREILTPPFHTHSFAGPPTATVRNPLGFIATNLASGALNYLGGQGVGWVMSFGGKPAPAGATKEDIERVQTGLADLQASVDGLSKQLAELTELVERKFTETQLQIITVNALPLAEKVDGVERNLTFYAQRCPPILPGSEPPDPYCISRRPTIESQLRDVTIDHSFETLSAYLLDKNALGSKGMIHLYSQSLGQTVRFFRPADSTKIQEMFEYWKSVQTQGANLKVELFHLDGVQNGPPQHNEVVDFLGNPNADPPTHGRFQKTLAAEQVLVFPPVPTNTVINTKDKMMWANNYPVALQHNACRDPFPGGGSTFSPIFDPVTFNGISGWRSPNLEQAQRLVEGWAGSSANRWLIDQTKAVAPEMPVSSGFPMLNRGSCTNEATIWTTTKAPPDPVSKYERYYTLSLANGGVYTSYYPYTPTWIFLARELKPGEQYYWYSNQ